MITSTPLVVGSYLAGALVLIGGLGVVLLPSVRAAAGAFVGCLIGVAALAFVLDAPILAGLMLTLAMVGAFAVILTPTRPSPARVGERGGGGFGWQPIAGAVAAAAVLAGTAIAIVKTSWPVFEPGTGASWREYLVGISLAVLTVLAAILGMVWRPPAESRHPHVAAMPPPPRRTRGRP